MPAPERRTSAVLLAASAEDGVGVGDAEHEQVDSFGCGQVDDGGSGVARLEQDRLAGDLGLPGGGFGLGEAGFALSGLLGQIAVDGIGAIDLDDVDREDARLASLDSGEVEGHVQASAGFPRAIKGNEDGDAGHGRSVLAELRSWVHET